MIRALVAGALLAGALAGCRAAPDAAPVVATIEAVTVTVEGAGGAHDFRAEVAETAAAQSAGLMHRTTLAPDAAMLFPFPQPKVASFWMEGTAIPLDILFIRADGTIARIAEDTVPWSREPVSSLEPVVAVLEIAGGRSAELGLRAGDRVRWPGGPA